MRFIERHDVVRGSFVLLLIPVLAALDGCGGDVRIDTHTSGGSPEASSTGSTGMGGAGGAGGSPEASSTGSTGGMGGAGGAGGSSMPPSCVGLAETCGPSDDENCCTSLLVSGGTYNRSNDPNFPATVSDFLLDRFEVTVGRFRKFVEGYSGNKPANGAGAHPLIANSGWNIAWNSSLPNQQSDLIKEVKCDASSWTDTPGANENLPMNCVNWYLAMAFCAWDGGRLPTEAEWNYAAAAESEQREYPWSNPPSSTMIDISYAVYDCEGGGDSASCDFADILKVGSKPAGDGEWGHADLGGSMWEWNLDWFKSSYDSPCNDCANLITDTYRVFRGGSWRRPASQLLSSSRNGLQPLARGDDTGVRCARTP